MDKGKLLNYVRSESHLKPKVYITRRIPEEVLRLITESCQVRIWDHEEIAVPRNILEQEIVDVDGLFCLLTETVDEPLLNLAGNLKIVSNMAECQY